MTDPRPGGPDAELEARVAALEAELARTREEYEKVTAYARSLEEHHREACAAQEELSGRLTEAERQLGEAHRAAARISADAEREIEASRRNEEEASEQLAKLAAEIDAMRNELGKSARYARYLESKTVTRRIPSLPPRRSENPLEPDRKTFLDRLERSGRRIAEHFETLPSQPAADLDFPGGHETARSVREPAPEAGRPFDEILDLLFDRLTPRSFNTAGPGYLAYIPGGGLPDSAIADLIADSVNRYTGVFAAAPGLAQLELNVLDWFRDWVGFPPRSGGNLTTGGSLATLSALVTARHERLGEEVDGAVIYVSDQVHHCVTKAARIAGFPRASIRVLPAGEDFRLSADTVRQAVAEDRAAGRRPFFLAASAGTTNTGAVDPLVELADLARGEKLWFHVDAAYGGFFLLTDRGRRTLAGIERADSVVLDPHKGLFLPYGTGALLVRDGAALRRAHSQDADYLPKLQDGDEFPDFCETSPELSRPFRGLRIWLPMALHGVGEFRRQLDEKLDLTEWIADELSKLDGIDLVAPPALSLLAFRVRKEGADAEEIDRRTEALLHAVNERQRVHITGTRVGGRYLARICVLSFRTHRDRMEMALEDIRTALPAALA